MSLLELIKASSDPSFKLKLQKNKRLTNEAVRKRVMEAIGQKDQDYDGTGVESTGVEATVTFTRPDKQNGG
jgi:hypothetical protein